MLTTLHEPNPPIGEQQLLDFSKRYGLTLPRSYCNFLLKHNGGRPEPEAFPIEDFPDNPLGTIQVFFGIGADVKTSDLDYVLTQECRNVPFGILPIACTDGYDFVCLDFRKPDSPVVFWDRKPYWGSEVWNEDDLYFVAKDFSSLLDDIRPFENC